MARPPSFNAQTIAAAGLAVVHREGWDALSFRSVANEVGVTAMALYRLVADPSALQALVADAAAIPLRPSSQAKALSDALRSWAVEAESSLSELSGIATYVLANWTELPNWLDIVEMLLLRAASNDLLGSEGVAIVNAVFTYVLARAQVHEGVGNGVHRTMKPIDESPQRYRHLAANRREYSTAQTSRHFQYGLELLLTGIDHRRDQ